MINTEVLNDCVAVGGREHGDRPQGDRWCCDHEDRSVEVVALQMRMQDVLNETVQQHGMSTPDLARTLGVSTATMRTTLIGKDSPTVHTVASVLHALGYRLEIKAVPLNNKEH